MSAVSDDIEPLTFTFEDDGLVPNNAMPFLVYKRAIDIDKDGLSKVLAAARKHGMVVIAYCPIARGKVPGNAVLERLGKAHGKSPAQVSLRSTCAGVGTRLEMSTEGSAAGTVASGFIAAWTRSVPPMVIPPSVPPARSLWRRSSPSSKKIS